jgi:hypothetical protein
VWVCLLTYMCSAMNLQILLQQGVGGSLVGIMIELWAGPLGFNSWQGKGFFFSSWLHPDLFWGLLSLLSSGCQQLFPWGVKQPVVKLSTHLHPLPRLRTRWAIPPRPHMSSWYGV